MRLIYYLVIEYVLMLSFSKLNLKFFFVSSCSKNLSGTKILY